jgi:hypothetical protein
MCVMCAYSYEISVVSDNVFDSIYNDLSCFSIFTEPFCQNEMMYEMIINCKDDSYGTDDSLHTHSRILNYRISANVY